MRSLRIALLVSVLLTTVGAAPPAAGNPVREASAPSAASTVVRTGKGPVEGEARRGHRLFRGIPYAQPPTGALRWRPPRPPRPWTGRYDATFPRSQCAQPAPSYSDQPPTYDEDCLYLNVTAPHRGHDRKNAAAGGRGRLPVMVWMHGGSNITGNGSAYDAAKLAVDGEVVVVTVNYRLGALGWLAHPGLETGADRRYQSGNYGLLDQQAALRWVQRNIAAFGGDPGNVTLFGESAGALDTCAHLVSPPAAGLFHKAAPQSYGCAEPMRTEHAAEQEAADLAAAVGCGDEDSPAGSAGCLRALPAETLVKAFQSAGASAWPVVGGDRLLPSQPAEAIERGRFHRVPVLHGNTLDEMRLFVSLAHPRPITSAQYEEIVRAMYGPDADDVLARYPAADHPEPRIALATLQTDSGTALSTCRHLTAFELLARAGVPVYAYQFADRDAPPLVDVPGFDEGAEHATELTYLFPGLLGELNPQQRRLSDRMVGYWTSFAHRGRPGTAQAPPWPRFRSADDVLSLAPGRGGIHPTNTAERSNCAFWESLER